VLHAKTKKEKIKMKKIMIALAVVAMAAVSQAASIKWNSGTINNQAGVKANGSTSLVTAYLYSVTADQYATFAGMDAGAIYAEAQKGTYGTAVATKATGSLGSANITQTVTGGSADAPVTYYGLILYVDEKSDTTKPYVMASYNTATFKDDGQVSFSNLANSSGDWTAAVPEPTSGLLLLLGVAGLALRRKQK
jgi:hypothetical protein